MVQDPIAGARIIGVYDYPPPATATPPIYAWEVSTNVIGKWAAAAAREFAELQDLLGDAIAIP